MGEGGEGQEWHPVLSLVQDLPHDPVPEQDKTQIQPWKEVSVKKHETKLLPFTFS